MKFRATLGLLLFGFASFAAAPDPVLTTDSPKRASVPGDPIECVDCAVREFEEMRAIFAQTFAAPTVCSQFGSGHAPICDVATLCRQIAFDYSGRSLYVSSTGAKIPNHGLATLENQMRACRKKVLARIEGELPLMQNPGPLTAGGRPSPTAAENRMEALSAEIRQKSRIFYATLKARGDEKAWVRISEQIETQMFQPPSSAGELGSFPPTDLGSIRVDIQAKQRLADVRISKFSEDAYVDLAHARSRLLDESRSGILPTGPGEGYANGPGNALSVKNPLIPEWPPILPNPFLQPKILNLPAYASVAEKVAAQDRREKFQTRADETLRLVERMRPRVIASILARRTAKNSAAIDAMVERVKTLHVNFDLSTSGACVVPNAYYEVGKHQITFCSQMLEFPDADLANTIAHEMTHAADSCSLAQEFYRLDSGEAERRLGGQSAPTSVDVFRLKAPAVSQTHAVAYFNEPKSLHEIGAHPGKYVLQSAGIPASRHPFAMELSCLADKKGLGGRRLEFTDFIGRLDRKIATWRRVGQTPENFPPLKHAEALRAKSPEFFDRYRDCLDLAPSSDKPQMNEALGDLIASESVEAELVEIERKNPGSARAFAAESLGHYLVEVCPQANRQLQQRVNQLRLKYGCIEKDSSEPPLVQALQEIRNAAEDEHPDDVARVERIFLANPGYRKALGCKTPSGTPLCR